MTPDKWALQGLCQAIQDVDISTVCVDATNNTAHALSLSLSLQLSVNGASRSGVGSRHDFYTETKLARGMRAVSLLSSARRA